MTSLPLIPSPVHYSARLGLIPPPPLISALGLPVFTTAPTDAILTLPTPSSLSVPTLPTAAIAGASSSSTPTAITPSIVLPGCPPLPQKLIQKITAWEYIDLTDLLPDQLHQAPPTHSSPNIVVLTRTIYDTQRRKKRLIPDISTWVQVFSTYMLVLASHSPAHALELISYQLLIVQHSKKFQYPSWLQYDTEFRQWAAANKCKTWSQIHPQIYAYAFTAQGKASSWCPVCQVDDGNHKYDCPCFTQTPPPIFHPQQPNKRYPLPSPPPSRPFPPPPKRPRPDYCILYNKNSGSCPYKDCKFAHKCSFCGQQGHPVANCPKKA